MNRNTKRLSAFLLAMLMALTGLIALAEQAPEPMGPEAVYARGNSIKTEAVVTVDPDAVQGLMTMFGQGATEDENSQAALNKLLAALGKVTTTIIGNNAVATYSMDTKDGKLTDGAVVVDDKQGEVYITSSLLPGIKLSYPPEMTKAIFDAQKQAADLQKMAQLFVPYGDALNKYMQEEVLPKVETVEGLYSIAGVGDYNRREVIQLNQEIALGVLKTIHGVFKDDTQLQTMLDDTFKAMPQQGEGQPSVPNSKEILKGMEDAIAKGKDAEPAVLGVLTAYSNKDGKGGYYEFETAEASMGSQPFFVTTQVDGDEKDMDVKIALVIKAPPFPAATEDATVTTPPEAAPVDWAAEKASILDGTNPGGILVRVGIKGGKDEAKNEAHSTFNVAMHLMGMQLGVTSEGKSTLTGDYKSEGKLSLSFMQPTPLLNLSFTNEEVKGATEYKPEEGLKAVMIQEEMSAEDSAKLQESLMGKGLPQLLEKLPTVLPEEGPILVAMLQGMLQPATQAPN